jgi:formylmethanofuran dehydrogenase subunit E
MRLFLINWFILTSFGINAQNQIRVIDTDFSKGRLSNTQNINMDDLTKFHGHLCDGLVVGYLGLQETLYKIFKDSLIDRTSLKIISKSSPCLTDAAIYLTGARYQYNTFYVNDSISYLMIVGHADSNHYYGFKLKPNVKPKAIDSLGQLASLGQLDECELKLLKNLEDDFSTLLLSKPPSNFFVIDEIKNYKWSPILKSTFIKTDTINKNANNCKNH